MDNKTLPIIGLEYVMHLTNHFIEKSIRVEKLEIPSK